MKKNTTFALLSSLVLIASCSSDYVDEEIKNEPTQDRRYRGLGKAFGEDTLTFGGPRKRDDDDSGLNVNSYLWRASLDTVSFMPIASADPFGGVILTDWYQPKETPNERYKVNIYIFDRQLRSDGIRVSLFKQIMTKNGWIDQTVDSATVRKMEDTILTRARKYRAAK